MTEESSSRTARVLGIEVEPLHMELALERVAAELEQERKGYMCLIGVHGIMEAQRDPALARIYAGACVKVPDGAPTVWVGRWQGFAAMDRVAGPDLMLEIFRRAEFAGYTHYFYGGKPGVTEELRTSMVRRFPWVKIVGTYTPPFRALTLAEEQAVAAEIRELKPDMLWVGISTPKQERFMSRMLPLIDSGLMFGVGAAFDFHTGRIKDSPEWVKRSGLQWLHRLIQDPRHLWWRYLRNNPEFLWRIFLQLSGIRGYGAVVADRGLGVRIDAAPGAGRTGVDRGLAERRAVS